MLFSGNRPCAGTSTDTGPCECESRLIITYQLMSSSVLLYQFQLKGHGMGDGVVGEPAQEHAIQMKDNAQCSILVTNHARQPQLIRDPVNVSRDRLSDSLKFSHTLVVFSDEGAWTTWGSWGACSGTCNSNTRVRSMEYSGNQICAATPTDTGNCNSEYKRIRNTYLLINISQLYVL